MNFLSNLLTVGANVPDWIANSVPVFRVIVLALLFLASITIVVSIMMQSDSAAGGSNAITGVQDSYYSQNKGSNKEGRLRKVTVVAGCLIAVLSVAYFIIEVFVYSG